MHLGVEWRKEALRKYFECDVMSEANFTLLNYGIRIYLVAQPYVKHRKVFFVLVITCSSSMFLSLK